MDEEVSLLINGWTVKRKRKRGSADGLQFDVFYLDLLMQKNSGVVLKLFFALGGEVMAGSVLGALAVDLGVTGQIMLKTRCHISALWHHTNTLGHMPKDALHQQGIVGAAQNDGIYLRVELHEGIDSLGYEIVGTLAFGLVCLDYGRP